MRTAACLAVIALAPFTDALAQELPLQPGQRVRITAPDLGIRRQAATLVALRGDTLVLTADSTVYCPLASVDRLEVHRGQRNRVGRGAAVGALTLGVAGAIGFVLLYNVFDEYPTGEERAQAAALGGGLGIVAGGLIGLGIGALIKTDRWEEVPLDQLRVRPVAGRDGFGVGVSVSF